MADTVRIYWKKDELPGLGYHAYEARVEGNGFDWSIFSTTDRDEFLRRYNALTVTKEPAPQEEG